MKHLTTLTLKYILPILTCLLAGKTNALPTGFFTQQSKLATGHWIKVKIGESGIYEISDDELKAMGFSSPGRVAVYGRGGYLQPENFLTAENGARLYTDDIVPVAMTRIKDKIYFYGEGTAKVNYCSAYHTATTPKRFDRESINTYSNDAFYYLTDSRSDFLLIDKASGYCNTSLPAYTKGWDYCYHEVDLINPTKSGREFFGESLADPSARRLEIPYSIDNAVEGGKASLVCRFVSANSQQSKLNYGIISSDGNETIDTEANLRTKLITYDATDQYVYADPAFSAFSLPSSQGTMYVEYTPSGTVEMANLDYFVLGAQTHLIFNEGASAMRTYTYDYNNATYGAVEIQNLPQGSLVWDITNSNNIKSLPYDYADDGTTARITNLADSKKEGLLIAFDPTREQLKVKDFQNVNNNNLHSIGTSGIPDMLIITLPRFKWAADEIARIHKDYDNLNVQVVLSDDVVNEFSAGVPDPMAYRALCKMIYERDNANNRKFRNVLLLGPMTYDARGIITPHTHDFLISPQSDQGNKIDATFCLNDIFGMMGDFYPIAKSGSSIYLRNLDLGVAILPVESDSECQVIIDKIVSYRTDDSFAYWCADTQYVGDGTDRFEHQNHCENLTTALSDLGENDFVGRKVYANAYPNNQITNLFASNLTDGQLFSTYVGHASARGMSGDFWKNKDLTKLSNNRLSFMYFAGCSISPFDQNDRGTGERMILHPNNGLIGGILTNRTAYSYSNYELMLAFTKAMTLQDPSDPDAGRLSTPITFGDIYKTGKNQFIKNANKMAYHLLADPALIPPLPTTQIVATINGSSAPEVAPSTRVEIKGSICDRNGTPLTDFNGTAVVKLYNTPEIKTIKSRYDTSNPPKADITFDETVVSISSINVTDGQFQSELFIPVTLAETTDGTTHTIRIAAFDPESRIASAGNLPLAILPYDAATAIIDTEAPHIEEAYINSSDFNEGDPVAPSFNFHAVITDDNGILWNGTSGVSAMYLQLDGENARFNLASHLRFTNDGQRCEISYPMTNIAPGLHTISVNAADLSGNTTSRQISFVVKDTDLTPSLSLKQGPVRTSAEFKIDMPADQISDKHTIVITNHIGKIVRIASLDGDTYDWDVNDDNGLRVPEGIYYAVCRSEAGTLMRGASQPVRLTVLKH